MLKLNLREEQVTGTGIWQIPSNVTRLRLIAWGGGAGAQSRQQLVVSGGGDGGLVEVELYVTPGHIVEYIVGRGGQGMNRNNLHPQPGEETIVVFPTTPLLVVKAFGGQLEAFHMTGGLIDPRGARNIIRSEILPGQGGEGGKGGQLGLPGGNGADGGLIFYW